MTSKKSRPGADDTGATGLPTQTGSQHKRLAQHRRASTEYRMSPALGHERNKPVKWAKFLTQKPSASDWLLYPFMERGQHASLYSEPKAGKSLLVLELATKACLGSLLDGSRTAPFRVLYLDYENPDEDILLRLHALQAVASDLEGLIYIQFPDLPPLDTKEGGAELIALVEKHRVDLVVVDTISRALDGLENDASTWSRFYQHTMLHLKRLGVASLRLDHAGKDRSLGARGSSAKNADVDAVWSMKFDKSKRQRSLQRTYTRRGRGPEEVVLAVEENPLRHVLLRSSGGSDDVVESIIRELDQLGVPPDAGRTRVRKALGPTPIRASTTTLEKVVKERKKRLEVG